MCHSEKRFSCFSLCSSVLNWFLFSPRHYFTELVSHRDFPQFLTVSIPNLQPLMQLKRHTGRIPLRTNFGFLWETSLDSRNAFISTLFSVFFSIKRVNPPLSSVVGEVRVLFIALSLFISFSAKFRQEFKNLPRIWYFQNSCQICLLSICRIFENTEVNVLVFNIAVLNVFFKPV